MDLKLITHIDKMSSLFNPVNVVGLGTTAGVEIGTTITFVNPGTDPQSSFRQKHFILEITPGLVIR